MVFTCLNINLGLLITGCNQAKYLSEDTSLDCLPPQGKSSASVGKGWMGSTWWPMEKYGAL